MKTFPELYHKGKQGELRVWRVWAENDTVYTEYGVQNGAMQISSKQAEAKNIGKANETTPEQQAQFEAERLWKHKVERKYSQTPEEAQEELVMPMLAEKFNPKKVQFPGYMQPKLDGVRCMAYWQDDKLVLMSRQNKEWTAPTHITDKLRPVLPKNTMLDGELYIHGTSLQTINSYVKKQQDKTLLVGYHIYDVPICDGDEGCAFSERLQYRNQLLTSIVDDHIHLVHTLDNIKYIDEVLEQEEEYLNNGFEGGIFRYKNGIYRFGYRSKDLMKVKTFEDKEFLVVDCIEGAGKMKGKAIFWCLNDINDEKFKVVVATSLEKRAEMFANKHKYIGQLLTVKFKGRSDAGVPYFPVGKAFRIESDLDPEVLTQWRNRTNIVIPTPPTEQSHNLFDFLLNDTEM